MGELIISWSITHAKERLSIPLPLSEWEIVFKEFLESDCIIWLLSTNTQVLNTCSHWHECLLKGNFYSFQTKVEEYKISLFSTLTVFVILQDKMEQNCRRRARAPWALQQNRAIRMKKTGWSLHLLKNQPVSDHLVQSYQGILVEPSLLPEDVLFPKVLHIYGWIHSLPIFVNDNENNLKFT